MVLLFFADHVTLRAMSTQSDDTNENTAEGEPPRFDDAFRAGFDDLLRWRRDVRWFRTDALPEGALDTCLDAAMLAPSVGNSQPWRFVRVLDEERRAAVRAEFERCNAEALGNYAGERAKLYAGLKLAGLSDAPEQLAIFCDEQTDVGFGLGQNTMPETLRYSVVGAVQTLWLAARARGIGVGWVSIMEPATINTILDVPSEWALVAYLCIGYPQEEHIDPELERAGWQARLKRETFLLKR